VPPMVGPLVGETDEIERGGVGCAGLSLQDIAAAVITATAASRTMEACLIVRASRLN
jgi:hypothetical protein